MTNDLEIRHCRALVAVNDHGGVSSAARALGLAQSTVSETLLSLERLIGAPVTLRRRGHEAVLTAAAQALLPHARGLIAASQTALAAVAMETHGVIRLGAVESVSSFLLPGLLLTFGRVGRALKYMSASDCAMTCAGESGAASSTRRSQSRERRALAPVRRKVGAEYYRQPNCAWLSRRGRQTAQLRSNEQTWRSGPFYCPIPMAPSIHFCVPGSRCRSTARDLNRPAASMA